MTDIDFISIDVLFKMVGVLVQTFLIYQRESEVFRIGWQSHCEHFYTYHDAVQLAVE